MRCAVCRCFLGAWRSPCRIWSIKGITACSFGCGRSVFLRGLGKALAIASRTIRRCTFTFLATPAIVPTPNSYSRRISSKSSTLALQSNGFPLSGYSPIQGIRSLPRWAKLDRRTGPIQSTEITEESKGQNDVPRVSDSVHEVWEGPQMPSTLPLPQMLKNVHRAAQRPPRGDVPADGEGDVHPQAAC